MERIRILDTIEANGALRLDYRCPGCGQLLSYELAVVTMVSYTLTPQGEEIDHIPVAKCMRCNALYDSRGKHICPSKPFSWRDLFST